MADPTIQTFCCHHTGDNDNIALRLMNEFNTDSYNILCLASSTLGIVGACYQILPRTPNVQMPPMNVSSIRARRIIIWLAIADLFASLGVFIRSAIWLSYKNIMPMQGDNVSAFFCALISAWTQYFYTSTWLWTLFYAVDTFLLLRGKQPYTFVYHTISWGLPILSTSIGLSILYIPNANCHNLTSLRSAIMKILPNYCANYIPILLVMIANPIIYKLAGRNVELAVSVPFARFTSRERYLVDRLKLKFFLINLVFYICWLPNLINGIMIWTLWFHLPAKVIVAVWYVMALLNPLQAFLNTFVYRRWVSGYQTINKESRSRFNIKWRKFGKSDEVNEKTPLLSSEPSRLQLKPLNASEVHNSY